MSFVVFVHLCLKCNNSPSHPIQLNVVPKLTHPDERYNLTSWPTGRTFLHSADFVSLADILSVECAVCSKVRLANRKVEKIHCYQPASQAFFLLIYIFIPALNTRLHHTPNALVFVISWWDCDQYTPITHIYQPGSASDADNLMG